MQRNDRKAPQTGSDTINALIATRSALAAPPVVIAPKNGIVELDLDQLDDNPDQPRQWMDPDAVEDIAASIFKRGTRQPDQPITVRPGGESGRYFIVMGHCRKAAKLLLRNRAPADEKHLWATIDAIVRNGVGDEQSAEMALDENIKRRDITAVEEGAAYARLLAKYSVAYPSKRALAKRLGIEEQRVQRMIRLFEAPPFLRDAILRGVTVPAPDRPESETEGPAKLRQVRRRLDYKAALQFLALYEQLTKQNAKNPIRAEEKAAERTELWIKRALEGGWSYRKIEEHCAGASAGREPRASQSATIGAPAGTEAIFALRGDRLVVHVPKYRELGDERRAAVLMEIAAHLAGAEHTEPMPPPGVVHVDETSLQTSLPPSLQGSLQPSRQTGESGGNLTGNPGGKGQVGKDGESLALPAPSQSAARARQPPEPAPTPLPQRHG